MALLVHLHPLSSSSSSSSSSFTAINTHHFQTKPTIHRIKSQQESSAEEDPSTKKAGNSSPGSGFGAVSTAAPAKKKQAKGKRERATIIRREPLEKPTSFPASAQEGEEARKNESAFLLAWLGLGAIILVEGIALAASGFLPEAWDKLLGKYLYPSFTPTVFVFIAGTTAYGVLKYLQNQNQNQNQNEQD